MGRMPMADCSLWKGCSWDGTQIMQTLTANNAGGNQRMPDKTNFTCVLVPARSAAEGGGKEIEVRMNDDKANALTSVQTDSLVLTKAYTLKIRGGIEVDSKGKKAGKGPLVQTELSATLGATQDQTLIVCRGGGTSFGLDRASFNQGANAKYDFLILKDQQPTLTARGPGAVCCIKKP